MLALQQWWQRIDLWVTISILCLHGQQVAIIKVIFGKIKRTTDILLWSAKFHLVQCRCVCLGPHKVSKLGIFSNIITPFGVTLVWFLWKFQFYRCPQPTYTCIIWSLSFNRWEMCKQVLWWWRFPPKFWRPLVTKLLMRSKKMLGCKKGLACPVTIGMCGL